MNNLDQVELWWTVGGLRGRVMKQLWSGTASSGATLTVSEHSYYNLFVVFSCGILNTDNGGGSEQETFFLFVVKF